MNALQENEVALAEDFIRHSNFIEDERSEEAFEDAMQAWEYAAGIEKMTPEEVKIIHRILMYRLRPDIAGKWRDCDIAIGGKVRKFVSDELFNEQIRETCEIINGSLKIPNIYRAAHVAFENIHPFEDGNGRVGRILYNWHRLRLGLPLHVIHEGEEQQEYYKWFR